MARPAVFLDRDGTIIREADYLRSTSEMRLLPRAAEAIRRLNQAGFAVVVATNQSGIARGLLSEADLEGIHDTLQRRLVKRGAKLDAIYYCPHHPEGAIHRYRRRCACRKPAPGMLLRAARELDLDLSRSFAVGDGERDVTAGRRAGCHAVLVRTGYGGETEKAAGDEIGADYVADNLLDAVVWILKQRQAGRRPA
jgi:D-glycero-D-manno-heptose 1,7-bisphosphate phosphatase